MKENMEKGRGVLETQMEGSIKKKLKGRNLH